jgi:hypothetical protein
VLLGSTQGGRRTRLAPAALLLLGVTAGQMIVLTVLGWNSNYWYDDLLYLSQVRAGSITLHQLMLPMFGHMAPGHRFTFWLLQHLAPGHYRVALLLEVLVSGAVTLVLARVLTLLSRRPAASAVLASLFAVSAVQVAAFTWLSAAADCIFSTLFTLVAAERFLVWRSSRRPWTLVASLLFWAIGLTFYEKTALLPVWLVALVGFVLPSRWSWRVAWREVADLWQAWAGFALVGLAWLARYAAGPYGTTVPKPSLSQWAGFLWVAWFKNLWPSLIGAPSVYGAPQAGLLVRCVAQLLFCALVVVTIVWRRAAWRAWAFFIGSFVIHEGLVAYGRAGWGASLGNDSFYVYESGWLLAIALACAVRRPDPVDYPAGEALRPARPRQAQLVSVGLVTVVLVVAAVRGATSAADTYSVYPGRAVNAWTHNVQTTAAALRQTGHVFSVFDDKAPSSFIQPDYPSLDRLSAVLGTGYAHLTYDTQSLPQYVVDPAGHLVPGQLQVQGSWSPTQSRQCWSGPKMLKLSHPVEGRSLFWRLRTDQPKPVQVRLWTRDQSASPAFATDTNGLVDLPAGVSDLLVPLAPTRATAVYVNAPQDAQVCVLSVQIGPAVAATG